MEGPDTKKLNDELHRFVFDREPGNRLDKFLVEKLPQFTRSRLQDLIANGFVTISGTPAKKAGQSLEAGQEIVIRIPPPVSTDLIPEKIPLEVIFENNDLLVINKPAGMVVHPSAGHLSGTLVNAVLGHDPDIEGIGGEERPGVVHRLDRGTSGLIVMAKNDESLHWLQDQFRMRQAEKTYIALVDGRPPTPAGRIEAPIGRDPGHRKKMAVRPADKGREAVSEYKTLEEFQQHTLLEFHPLTGRTHQVRLHCAFLGCPIAGDTLYGRKRSSIDLDRHFLHALRLKFKLPGEDNARVFEAPLAKELMITLEKIRSNKS